MIYTGSLDTLKRVAEWQTRFFQCGYLRVYIMVVLGVLILLLAPGLIRATTLVQRGGTGVRA